MLLKRDPWVQFEECLMDVLGEMEKMLQTTSNGKKTIDKTDFVIKSLYPI